MCGTARSSYTTFTVPLRCTTLACAVRGSSAERASDHTPCAGSRKGPSAGAGPMRRAPTKSAPPRMARALARRRERSSRELRERGARFYDKIGAGASTLRPRLRRHPDVRAGWLLARYQIARRALGVWAERFDVAVHRAQVAIAHQGGIPPRHGRLAIAAIGGPQHLDPVIFVLALRNGAQVLPIHRAPLAPESHVESREPVRRRNFPLQFRPALRMAIVAAADDREILASLLHRHRLHGGTGARQHDAAAHACSSV